MIIEDSPRRADKLHPMFSRVSPLVAAGVVLCLCGCHADITERVAFNPDKTATVTYTESLDRELFDDVSKIGGADPFRKKEAIADGWTVSESTTGDRDHVITYSKTARTTDLKNLTLPEGAVPADKSDDDSFSFSPGCALPFALSVSHVGSSAPSDKTGTMSVPSLLATDQAASRPGHDPDLAAARANALLNAGAVDGVVSVHLEIQSWSKPTTHDGKLEPDGAIRWDLSFARTTTFTYAMPDMTLALKPTVIQVNEGQPDVNDPSLPPMPQGADVSAIYASGHAFGASPYLAWQSVGNGGTYDFMRWGKSGTANQDFRRASMFSIGVYLNGAKVPESVMDTAMQLLDR